MTNEEAIQFLDNIKHEEAGKAIGKAGFYADLMGYHVEALNMAIKALEQEPKTDTWSIKDVADTFKKHGLIREQEPSITWVTGSDGAKIAFKDVPAWKVIKICQILADVVEAEEDQEPKTDVLDTIRTEIEELADADGYGDYQLGFSFGLMMAMEIIDKYKAESEPQESENCN